MASERLGRRETRRYRGARRSRSASVRITALAKYGVSCTRKRKFFSAMGATSHSVLASAVGAGRAVDQGHLAENSRGRHCLDYPAVAFDLDRARAHHVHFVALVAGSEDKLAGLEAHRRRAGVGKKLVVDHRDSHPPLLLNSSVRRRYDGLMTVV